MEQGQEHFERQRRQKSKAVAASDTKTHPKQHVACPLAAIMHHPALFFACIEQTSATNPMA
jgi:hypothetical protein